MNHATARIAAWASGLSLADVPESAVERARLQTAAGIAAARAGAGARAVSQLRAATRGWAAKGPSAVVGERFKLEPAAAAYANAAASIAHDWDDYLYMGDTGHSAVWASRAVGESTDASDEQVLVAQIAANEVAGRIGAALFLGPHNGQFWSSIHCAGAAVAAGKVMGLDEERLAHAIAVALYQPPYGLWPGFMGPDTKLLTAADPTMQGIRAAVLAAEGLSGPLDVIEDRRGFLAHLSFAPRPSMLEGLGRVWLTDTLAFKPYPGCAYLQSAVEALLRLREEEGFEADDVAAVEVRGGYLTTGMERLAAGPTLTPVRVNFSVALSLAVCLLAGRLTHEELDEPWLAEREDELRRLASRVRLEHDWDLTLATVRGAADAMPLEATIGDVPPSGWLTVRRRMRELGMDELELGWGDLRELLGRTDVRSAVLGLVRGGRAGDGRARGLEALDVERLRLTFPTHVRVRLRSGASFETDGREPGACGAPISEQREVVERKEALTGGKSVHI